MKTSLDNKLAYLADIDCPLRHSESQPGTLVPPAHPHHPHRPINDDRISLRIKKRNTWTVSLSSEKAGLFLSQPRRLRCHLARSPTQRACSAGAQSVL